MKARLDRSGVTPGRRVAEKLNVGYKTCLLPEQKIEAVQDLVQKTGSAGMVHDGVHEALALAASSVGFAMGAAGTDVALETADVALMQDDLSKLAEAVRVSRAAERIIKQNVAVSILIKGLRSAGALRTRGVVAGCGGRYGHLDRRHPQRPPTLQAGWRLMAPLALAFLALYLALADGTRTALQLHYTSHSA